MHKRTLTYVNHFLAIVGALTVIGLLFKPLAMDVVLMIAIAGTLPLIALDRRQMDRA